MSRQRDMTVVELAETWLRNGSWADTTTLRYQSGVRSFVAWFGDRALGTLSGAECHRWARSAPPSSVRAAKTMLAFAVHLHLLTVSPLSGVRRPHPPRRREPLVTHEDVLALAQTAERHLSPGIGASFRGLIEFALGSLLRPSELCVLQWDDIDLKTKCITVERHLRDTGTVVRASPHAMRTIALTPLAASALARIPREVNCPSVFHNANGEHLSLTALRHRWHLTRRAHASTSGRPELAGLTFYDATRLVGAAWMYSTLGLSRAEVNRQMGHHPDPREWWFW